MKYILILALLFTGCLEAPEFDGICVITQIKSFSDNHCMYKTNRGKFYDYCNKFNIGDTVTSCKKGRDVIVVYQEDKQN